MQRVAMLIAEGFQDAEVEVPRERLGADHEVVLVGRDPGARCRAGNGRAQARADISTAAAGAEAFQALLIPGGRAPEQLRTDPDVLALVRAFVAAGKPVAAICHGPQVLINADVVRGRRLTSYPGIRRDLENAGADWVDAPVVEDGPLITSRDPGDLEAFTKAVQRRL